MSNYADDVRRIAAQKKIKGGLDSKEDRDSIPGSITPYLNNDIPETNGDGATKSPSKIDSSNPNSFITGSPDAQDNEVDAEELLDGKEGPQLPNFSDGQEFNATKPISKITGLKDCDTDQCVKLNMDGEFIPPEGWDDAETPPEKDGFIQGTAWYNTSDDYSFSSTLETAANNTLEYNIRTDGVIYTWTLISINAGAKTSDMLRIYNYDQSQQIIVSNFSTIPCTPGVEDYCPIYAPTETEWPADGCYDLALQEGKFVSSQYDSEAPASTKEDRSDVTLCTTNGRRMKTMAAINGGYMLEEVNAQGQGVGMVRVYNSDGTLRAAGDHSTQFIESNRPK